MKKKVLIVGENSYVGSNVERWLMQSPDLFEVDTVGSINEEWKNADFSKFDTVYHVAGIAHVDAKPKMEALYRSVNTNLAIEVARWAKANGVRQFIFMSSMIVYHESKSLKPQIVSFETKPNPNNFYGDSKLQAEIGIKKLEDEKFKVCILRPPMIYGPSSKGNFMRLAKLATITPVFPDYHNKRSMLYIDNLSEFVKQAIMNNISGVFCPQNAEYADTVDIVMAFAKQNKHKIFVWKGFNILVKIGAPFIVSINKMFADSYYIMEMSRFEFDYWVVTQEESFKRIAVPKKERNNCIKF